MIKTIADEMIPDEQLTELNTPVSKRIETLDKKSSKLLDMFKASTTINIRNSIMMAKMGFRESVNINSVNMYDLNSWTLEK